MLGQLFGSQARVKILKIFLFDPDKKYYIRQLARDLKLQVNSVRRELENLEDFGLLSSHFEGGEDGKGQDKKYFQVSKNFVLFDAIKSLITKSQLLHSQNLIHKINKICVPKLLILTGIFTNNPRAKTDVLIVAKVSKVKLNKIMSELEESLGREINYTLMDSKEFKYRNEITDVFLYNILESNKIVLVDELTKKKEDK